MTTRKKERTKGKTTARKKMTMMTTRPTTATRSERARG